jgi:hypothetical protein
MEKIADWLKQSKGAPFLAVLLVFMFTINIVFDFVLKAPTVFRGQTNNEAGTTLNSLVLTLRSTNEALQQITESNAKIISTLQTQNLAIGNISATLDDAHRRQITRTEFQSEMDALKKKVERLEK